MTYGWAVLIIGVILGAMFNLGIFSSSSLAGTSCLGATGFTCQNPSMIPTGVITFLFGQATGKPMYNVQFECVASTGANNLPNPSNAFNSMASTGAMLPYSDSGNTLSNGQLITVSALQCYDTNGNLITSLAVGAAYSGYVYINYTTLNVAHSGLSRGPAVASACACSGCGTFAALQIRVAILQIVGPIHRPLHPSNRVPGATKVRALCRLQTQNPRCPGNPVIIGDFVQLKCGIPGDSS